MLGSLLFGVCFDLKGNVRVTDSDNNKVVQLSQDGRLLQTIHHASSKRDYMSFPYGISVSTEGLIYICDSDNCRVTVHDEDSKFLFAFGSIGVLESTCLRQVPLYRETSANSCYFQKS